MDAGRLTELFQPRCPLINPLCPGDLCVLWPGHRGSSVGHHLLGTMPGSADEDEDEIERHVRPVSSIMYLSTELFDDETLIKLGCAFADVLWPNGY